MRATGGTFNTYLSTLRREHLLVETDHQLALTADGLASTGRSVTAAPVTAEQIREQWRAVLRAGARRMLEQTLEAYPDTVTRQDLAAAAGIEPTGGTFGTYLSTLRRNGLVTVERDQIRAAEVLFLEPSNPR